MAIKAVSKERIEQALLDFDRRLRNTHQWHDWTQNPVYRHAIQVANNLYPPKKIVSLATGVPEDQFVGGHSVRKYLQKRGFTIAELPPNEGRPALQFTRGAIYDRQTEINGPFGGSRQSGISPSKLFPAIFLFTGESGEQYGYEDGWDAKKEFYLYTGQGQQGEMTLTLGNKAIAEHAENGKALHLFQSLGKSNGYSYVGEFCCADRFTRIQPDLKGQDRTAIVFRLVPVDAIAETPEYDVDYEVDAPNLIIEARKAALAACKPESGVQTQSAPRNVYQRSRQVARYVLMRAKGRCESCEKPAPFTKKDGSPYLEPHHVNRLSDGGLDHPQFVGAVCPNCHREIHSGVDGAKLNEQLKTYLKSIESQN
ncbi:HNH endonuclease [Pseudomonas sp. LJDD11]|nr:HNH endonuclease [Pseudomonas sp. LJDD11]